MKQNVVLDVATTGEFVLVFLRLSFEDVKYLNSQFNWKL